MLPITAFACLAAYSALAACLPQCVHCHSGDIQHAPLQYEPYRYRCNSCTRVFTRPDDAPVGLLDAFDAYAHRGDLYR
ncbi:hypothetical protein Pan44_14800 [Caulifigura coniformis]|uniref:Uncharacterized protein n=2 Tax=Caulifigura coniformis TaxID=2527983 RepID=A0A517SBF8_9PLAN|nr:hypothetical protein Pan44_14800 [Caulifigura coniformis]